MTDTFLFIDTMQNHKVSCGEGFFLCVRGGHSGGRGDIFKIQECRKGTKFLREVVIHYNLMQKTTGVYLKVTFKSCVPTEGAAFEIRTVHCYQGRIKLRGGPYTLAILLYTPP